MKNKNESPTIKAAKFWDLKIPITTPKGPTKGYQFGKEVVKDLNRLGFKFNVKYKEKSE